MGVITPKPPEFRYRCAGAAGSCLGGGHWMRAAFPSYAGWLFVTGTILFSFSL
jgi:hypothetical protein